eukprot:6180935-Pleurochrysis_carterae.AAC.1
MLLCLSLIGFPLPAHLQARGVDSGSSEHDASSARNEASASMEPRRVGRNSKGEWEGRGSRGAQGRSAFASRETAAAAICAAVSDDVAAPSPLIKHILVASELLAVCSQIPSSWQRLHMASSRLVRDVGSRVLAFRAADY